MPKSDVKIKKKTVKAQKVRKVKRNGVDVDVTIVLRLEGKIEDVRTPRAK